MSSAIDERDPLAEVFTSIANANPCPKKWGKSLSVLPGMLAYEFSLQIVGAVSQTYKDLVERSLDTLARNLFQGHRHEA